MDKILIANRGEIATRVIRTCRDLGIRTVAVASEADANSLAVAMADESYIIGPAPAAESYLVADKILDVARRSGADGIHPGYGFLSENPGFADACRDAGVTFIGPPASAIDAMGEKTRARAAMAKAGVPVVPGTEALSEANVVSECERIGFPVMLKAASGGGGKGMRVVWSAAEVLDAFRGAQRTAAKAFADDRVYAEKFIVNPRHIEIQFIADTHGHAVYFFERECSVQRRHQKIIEEAPASVLSEATRARMGEIAVTAALAIGYANAGTCEFIVDPEENAYFLEMNTRLQVEHPVTEWITGVDLVAEQIAVARGEKLRFRQEDLAINGHAIECRIYAEDPFDRYLPSPGTLSLYRPPLGPGVRVDSGVYEGATVPEHYDPMIAKLAVWGPNRDAAIRRSLRALREFQIGGIRTNMALLQAVLEAEPFLKGRYDTGVLEHIPLPAELPAAADRDVLLAMAALLQDNKSASLSPAPSTGRDGSHAWRKAGRIASVVGGR